MEKTNRTNFENIQDLCNYIKCKIAVKENVDIEAEINNREFSLKIEGTTVTMPMWLQLTCMNLGGN